MKQEINLNICAESRGNLRVYIPKTEVISMRKNVTERPLSPQQSWGE